jgi:stress-induced morphogen
LTLTPHPWVYDEGVRHFQNNGTGSGMISPDDLKSMIRAGLPDATVEVQDLTGGGDHYQAVVVSAQFQGKRLVQQHQLVNQALKSALDSGEIHALALKTYTPEEWPAATAQGNA